MDRLHDEIREYDERADQFLRLAEETANDLAAYRTAVAQLTSLVQEHELLLQRLPVREPPAQLTQRHNKRRRCR